MIAFASVVENCSVNANRGAGIDASASIVHGCDVSSNEANGITAQGECRITNNICINNGRMVMASGIAGILGGNHIEGNTVIRTNGGTDAPSGGNGIATAGGGNLVIRNSARGNANNYLLPGDTAGPIVTSADIATNTNPAANFAY